MQGLPQLGHMELAQAWKFIIKGSLAEKLPIYERHPSKVK